MSPGVNRATGWAGDEGRSLWQAGGSVAAEMGSFPTGMLGGDI